MARPAAGVVRDAVYIEFLRSTIPRCIMLTWESWCPTAPWRC